MTDSITNKLKQEFDHLKESKVDIFEYEDKDETQFLLVADIMSSESFVAGFATSLLNNGPVSIEFLGGLDSPFLNGRNWVFFDGAEVKEIPILDDDIFEYALSLEKVRHYCLALLEKKGIYKRKKRI